MSGERVATVLPESQEDIKVFCDTEGLITMVSIAVAEGWDERSKLCKCVKPLTTYTHRELSLRIVSALKLAALSKQRKRDELARRTAQVGPRILGSDGEPYGS